jgi:hypothetical protein
VKSLEELTALSPASPFCMFSYLNSNLGDYIQTLALLQHVAPRRLIPRDRLTAQENLVLLANGWMMFYGMPRREWFRDVRYVGVHIATQCRNAETAEALRPCGIIGCRDPATAAFAQENGLPAALVGCATLTFPLYQGTREGVYCTDISDRAREEVSRLYKDAIAVSHYPADEENAGEQQRRAYALLAKYERAELVVTSRLHAALPCVAFGTPVVYVGPGDDRTSILDEIGIRMIGEDELTLADLRPEPVEAPRLRQDYLEFLEYSMYPFMGG